MFDEAIFPYKILVDSSISSPYTQEQLVQCLNLSLSSSQPIISNSYLGGHNSNTQIRFDSLFTIMMFSLLTIFFTIMMLSFLTFLFTIMMFILLTVLFTIMMFNLLNLLFSPQTQSYHHLVVTYLTIYLVR